jgi:UDP-N-acetyl-D-glucosamine dehydrogenase
MDMQALLNKFKDRTARVAVIGAGYVGLPFAVECAASGIETVAIDLDPDKIRQINEGKSYIGDVSDADLAAVVGPGTLRGSTDTALLGEADGIVRTPTSR